MPPVSPALSDKFRLAVLLKHFSTTDNPRDVRRVTHPLSEILLLVVCGTIADCDDYDHIAAWGEAHLTVVRHFALNLVRTAADTKSIKLRRKMAGWSPNYLDSLLAATVSWIWIRSPGPPHRPHASVA